MVGLFDDSKVEKLIGELHDIELYGDCAKASIKVIIFLIPRTQMVSAKYRFLQIYFRRMNSNKRIVTRIQK